MPVEFRTSLLSRGYYLKVPLNNPLKFNFIGHDSNNIERYDEQWSNDTRSPGFKVNRIRGVKKMEVSLNNDSPLTSTEFFFVEDMW